MATTYVRKRARPDVIGKERRPASVVPRIPRSFDAALTVIWRELWRTPVAATWTVSDERLVQTLCRLHHELELGMAPVEKVAGQIANLSTQLGLTPKARIILSIEEQAAPVADPEAGRGKYRIEAA